MGLLSILFKDPAMFVLLAFPLIFSIVAHEAAHGWVALLFGDDTAKRAGRLSLNPLLHLDPVGTIALLIMGFGWAKPVPVDYRKLGNSRIGLISVSLAGCAVNILIAAAAMFFLQIQGSGANSSLAKVLFIVARVNLILGAFNLIPIPPLDGSKVLMGFLPYEAQRKLAGLEPYGFYIIIILLFTGVLTPVIILFQNAILAIIKILLSLTGGG